MAKLARLLSSIAALAVCSCSEVHNLRDMSSVSIETRHGITMVNDTIFSGALVSPIEVRGYRHGKEHGTWKKFHSDGSLAELRYFRNGKKSGMYQAWWDNGQLRSEYHFANDEYDGLCRDWTRTGQLIRQMNYENGHEKGMQQLWDTDGTIRANYVAKNGRNYGLTGVKACATLWKGDSVSVH